MNLTVELTEAPTSCHFGANQLQLAVYPLVAKYKLEQVDGVVHKAAIVFFSDDLGHDNQQVSHSVYVSI